MRIPGKLKAAERAAVTSRAANVGSKKTAEKTKRSGGRKGGVSASVSAKARSLADEGNIDVAKVEKLRELIESGQFAINFQLIAERILQHG